MGRGTQTRARTRTRTTNREIIMKAKELAEILLTVPEWDVCINEDRWGISPAKIDNKNLIDPKCQYGEVILGADSTEFEPQEQ